MNKRLLKSILKSKPPFIPKFCNRCGKEGLMGHPLIYCIKCPGKYIEYPKMTWKDCLGKDFNYYYSDFIDKYYKRMDVIDPDAGVSKVGWPKKIKEYVKEIVNS